eukprot:165185-Prymnesium_polylepis.1
MPHSPRLFTALLPSQARRSFASVSSVRSAKWLSRRQSWGGFDAVTASSSSGEGWGHASSCAVCSSTSAPRARPIGGLHRERSAAS